jgi:hypothetical protein
LYEDYDYKFETKTNFPFLRRLKVAQSAIILKCIGDHKIEDLSISDRNNVTECQEFLETCKDLKKFELEHFCNFNFPRDKTKVENFLLPHKETLKKLKCRNNSWNFVTFAVNEMNIEELLCEEILINSELIFKPNKSIKNLFISFQENQLKESRNLFEACKNVEKLTIATLYEISRKDLKIICENMKNLKILTLHRMTTFIHSMTFQNLEILRIFKVFTKDEHKSWISLAKCCPKIRKILITQQLCSEPSYTTNSPFNIDPEDLKDFLKNCKNIHELHIGPNFDFTDEFIETILSSESKSFWYLRIESENFEEDAEKVKKIEGTKIRCEIVRNYKDDE